MSDKTFKWSTQFNVGQRGEQIFQEAFPTAVKTDGRIEDFILNGEKIELKTDSYSMDKTPNFFFEYRGNVEKQSLGGPWRTANDNIEWFVYLFLLEKKFFWFPAKKLVKFLDANIAKFKPKTVRNKGYDTVGFAIPREFVKHLEKDGAS